MSAQEGMAQPASVTQPTQRVVEAEIKLPKWEEMQLPKVNLEPVRVIAEQVLITGIGVGILLGRGIMAVVKAANNAGQEEAQHPGPVSRVLLGLVQPAKPVVALATTDSNVQIPVLPINNYDALSAAELAQALPALSAEQRDTVRQYEANNRNRAEVLQALGNLATPAAPEAAAAGVA